MSDEEKIQHMLELTEDVKAPVYVTEKTVYVRSTKDAYLVAVESIKNLLKKKRGEK